MDLSFKCDNKKFNYRVCAMIISDNRILAMHDQHSPYFYLPGGRVSMGETAEQAIICGKCWKNSALLRKSFAPFG